MTGIEIKNVTKRYGATLALDNVSLTLQPGRIYGLLGRNGAGKTTLLNILTGRIFPDGGEVTLNGLPLRENDAALGQIFMLSEATLYPEKMRIKDVIRWTGTFYPGFDTACAQRLCQAFTLNERKRVKSLSTGYKTIFKLILALSCGAPFVLLDEPVLGLDANHRDLFYKTLIEQYSQSPSCFILSTHLVEEISTLVEEVIIIKEGRVLKNEPRETLMAQGYTVSGTAAVVDAYIAGRQVLGTDAIGGLKSAYLLGTRDDTLPEGLEVSPMDLQRLFIQLTN